MIRTVVFQKVVHQLLEVLVIESLEVEPKQTHTSNLLYNVRFAVLVVRLLIVMLTLNNTATQTHTCQITTCRSVHISRALRRRSVASNVWYPGKAGSTPTSAKRQSSADIYNMSGG